MRSKVLGRIVRILQFTIGTCFPDNSRVIPIFIAVILCAPRPTGIERRINYQPLEFVTRRTTDGIDNPCVGHFIRFSGHLPREIAERERVCSRIFIIQQKILFRTLHSRNCDSHTSSIMKITYSQRVGIPLIKIRHSRTIGIGVDGSGRIVIEKFEVSLAQARTNGNYIPCGRYPSWQSPTPRPAAPEHPCPYPES